MFGGGTKLYTYITIYHSYRTVPIFYWPAAYQRSWYNNLAELSRFFRLSASVLHVSILILLRNIRRNTSGGEKAGLGLFLVE